MKTPTHLKSLAAAALTGLMLTACVVRPPLVQVHAPAEEYIYNVPTAPPIVQAEAYGVQPSPAHFWVPGHWAWNGGTYIWVRGRWDLGRAGYVWAPNQWILHPNGGWRMRVGHWRRV